MTTSQESALNRLEPLRSGDLPAAGARRLIDEVNRTIAEDRRVPGAADFARAQDQLVRSGALPNLILAEFGNLDRNRDGRVTEQELLQTINTRGRDGSTFLTGVAARGLRGLMREMGGTEDPTTGEYSVDRNRFQAHLRASQNLPRPEGRPEARPEGEQPRPQDRAGAERPRPPLNPNPEAQRQIDILQSGNGSQQERLAAVRELARLGVSRITLVDSNGDMVDCRVQVGSVGRGSDRNYVHLWARDERGRERIILRGVEQNGQIGEQRDNRGQSAGFVGHGWNRARPQSAITRVD